MSATGEETMAKSMDEESKPDSGTTGVEGTGDDAKKAAKKAKKDAEKALKESKKAEREAQLAAERAAGDAIMNTKVESIENESFGYLPVCTSSFRTSRVWTRVVDCNKEKTVNQHVWIRARLHESRCKGNLGFIVLREQFSTIQAVLDAQKFATKQMIKWASGLPLESIVDVYGLITDPGMSITGATQQVELQVAKFFCANKSLPELPFLLKDANRPDNVESTGEGDVVVRVSQDTRLDNRILDLRTLANQAIFRISSMVCVLFREYLLKNGFIEIHTPKLLAGSSEGGSNVFQLKYFGRDSCLAQSPQLHKQMSICSDFGRVFEIGPVFRAENSNTHRHLCEFTGLDIEMSFYESYHEVLDVLDQMFQYIFKGLNERCPEEIKTVYTQHPNRPFQWLPETPRIDFAEGCQMLRDAGVKDIPDDLYSFDLSTEQEKTLGRLIFEKYRTDFYFLINFPLGVRPFYTMPSPFNSKFSNSYDFFMRGEEIVSGAQRVHDPELLTERAKACGLDVNTIKSYIDSFRLGSYPHAGCGVGLERVVMLFLGLPNIRKSSMFPRDPKRLEP